MRLLKWIFFYWIAICIFVGIAAGEYSNQCGKPPVLKFSDVVTFALTSPIVIGMIISKRNHTPHCEDGDEQ